MASILLVNLLGEGGFGKVYKGYIDGIKQVSLSRTDQIFIKMSRGIADLLIILLFHSVSGCGG